MDVKRYDLGKDQEHVCDCDMMDWPDGEYVLYEDIEKHYIPRPDPAEVERLVDMLIIAAQEMGHAMAIEKVMRGHCSDLKQARADLLKLVGGE